MSKIQLGVMFGSRSCEHEVSIISAVQLMRAADRQTYDVIPIYISKKGEWFTGDPLFDIATYTPFDENRKDIRRVQLDLTAGSRALISRDAHISGLVAAGLHPSPIPYADVVTTTTHKTLRGPRGGLILCKEKYAKAIDKAIFPGMQGGPLMHVIAAKAVALKEALQPSFKIYAAQIIKNSQALAEELIKGGFNLVSGGTDNHLILVDVRNKHLTGKAAEKVLDTVHITVNKNTVPNETESPFVTSGIRIGTAALTSRGMKEEQMRLIGGVMTDALNDPENKAVIASCNERIAALCRQFPLYSDVE